MKNIINESVYYHGTISDFVEKIKRDKKLIPPSMGSTKVSWGFPTETGMVWVTPDLDVAHLYSQGFEANMGTNLKGLKATVGGIFHVEIDDSIRLIDRNAPLNQKQVDILNQTLIPHYKPLKVGDSLTNAEHRISQAHGLHDLVKALGYDGVIYSENKQIGLVGEVPVTAFTDPQGRTEKLEEADEPPEDFEIYYQSKYATPELMKAFAKVHDQQRWEGPESMFDEKINPHVDFGTGLWMDSLEHGGDLIHRLSYSGTNKDFGGGGPQWGKGAALEKAERLLRRYTDRYGIDRDVWEQIGRNFEYFKSNHGFQGTKEEFIKLVKEAGERYAKEYEKIQPVTIPQKLGRDVAIHTGRFEFSKAVPKLKALIRILKSPDWEKYYWQPLTKNRGSITEEDNTRDIFKNANSWLDPHGKFFPVSYDHDMAAVGHCELLGIEIGRDATYSLWKIGWQRITHGISDKDNGGVLHTNNEIVRPNHVQQRKLVELANQCDFKTLIYDTGQRHVILWDKTDVLEEAVNPQRINKRLIPLIKLAKYYNTFEEFERDYQQHNYHGIYWHLTDNPNFVIEPTRGPRDLSSMAVGGSTTPGLMVSTDLGNWYSTFNQKRKFAAQIDLSDLEPNKDYRDVSRGFGHEIYVLKPEGAKVVAVYPIKQALRISNNDYRRVLPQNIEQLKKLYDMGYSESQPLTEAELSPKDFEKGAIYILHFDTPFKHARHYIGWAHNYENLKQRLEAHRKKIGSKLMKHVVEANITYRLVFLKPGDRNEERRMKKYHRGGSFCWICKHESEQGKKTKLQEGLSKDKDENRNDLIFTVGKQDIYEPYLKTKDPKKRAGGSVWKTYDEAKRYVRKGYDVYGVVARWNVDTKRDPNGKGWHILLISALLKKLDKSQRNPLTEVSEEKRNLFKAELAKEGLDYLTTDDENALHWRNNIYPTITNKERTIKLALDTTNIYTRPDRSGVWVGDPSQPLPNGYVLQALVADPEIRGKGETSAFLKKVLNAANRCGIMLKGEPAPMKDFIKRGQKSLTKSQLLKWYKKLGFKDLGGIIQKDPDNP